MQLIIYMKNSFRR